MDSQPTAFDRVPCEILEKIASSLAPYMDDVRAFSLISTKAVAPARRILFEDCIASIDEAAHTISAFSDFIQHTDSIQRVMKTLTLRCNSSVGPLGSEITLDDIADLLSHLPMLSSLALAGFQWKASPLPHPAYTPHEKLARLSLNYISCTAINQSPLDLLRFSRMWSTVRIEELYPLAGSADVRGGPFHLTTLRLSWCPFASPSRLGLEDTAAVISHVKHLIATDIIDQQAVTLRQCIDASAATLEKATLELTNFGRVRNLDAWLHIVRGLKECPNIRTVVLSIPVKPRWLIQSHRGHSRGLHVEALFKLCRHLPETVQYLKVHFEVDDAVSDYNAKHTVHRILTYDLLRNHLSIKPSLVCLHFDIHYVDDRRPAWTDAEVREVDDAFKFLHHKTGTSFVRNNSRIDEHRAGSVTLGEVKYYRSEAHIEGMEKLWQTKYL
ncbi:hypothetical protein EIP86_000603 [Pleurotus ostreatoroseus]|nr:hypothetical protein EIP86_000603 [Pleurotus ostreatoroseus]